MLFPNFPSSERTSALALAVRCPQSRKSECRTYKVRYCGQAIGQSFFRSNFTLPRSPRPHRPSAAVSSSRPPVLMLMLMLLRIASCPSRRVNRCLMPQATLHDALYSFLAHSKRAPLAASATVSAALLQRESPALIGAPSPTHSSILTTLANNRRQDIYSWMLNFPRLA